MNNKIIYVALMVIFTGCATSGFTKRENVQIKQDEFSNDITYLGITQQGKTGKTLGDFKYNFFLRSWQDKQDSTVENQLYVTGSYIGDWRFFERAAFKGGQDADFKSINRDVAGCTYGVCTHKETFGITIPFEYLKDNSKGFQVKVYAKSGDEAVINVTAKQIQQQLAMFESRRN